MLASMQCNYLLKWAWSGSLNLKLKFEIPSTTFEQLKLCTHDFPLVDYVKHFCR